MRGVLDRFASKSMPEPNTGCWFWLGHLDRDGYGTFNVTHTERERAHRFALALRLGRPVVGLVLHSCDQPSCVNADHLREGTQRENIADMDRRGRRARGYKRPWRSGAGHWMISKPGSIARGERANKSSLTVSDVLAIRESRESSKALAERYAVTRGTIRHIRLRLTWVHV